MGQASPRGLAIAALAEWRQTRRFADSVLQGFLARSELSSADRAFATELFYGVLRNLTLLDFWIKLLRPKPVDDLSRELLRFGLYQLLVLRTPGHAAVFETVALASARRRPLINAILRTAQRRVEELEGAAQEASLSIRKSHPEFLLERWRETLGESNLIALCDWDNEPAPVYARINLLKTSPEQFLRAHAPSVALPGLANFVRLTQIPTEALDRGECYIQDPSTRLACDLLDPQPGENVLDACAAPGGKTGLLAELMENRGRLIACDRDETRVAILRENLERLGATTATAVLHDWHSGDLKFGAAPALFDRILLDAPCTNTGVLRRRVDLRWRLSPSDFARMPQQQMEIMRAVLPHLRAGGWLVYSTCSLEPEENQRVVEQALREFPFLHLTEERQSLPFRDHFDGAFAAKLTRRS
ncbi:MAG TPA: 16S rRNA (cytosine(967)-C(5))-methyltransferase RsmB [Chthoniobacterales bacterium]|nr:16S rRNA (cytosine(967)-C(5))-methyltransferase RsmB [Chthoniobacterales bacterium]